MRVLKIVQYILIGDFTDENTWILISKLHQYLLSSRFKFFKRNSKSFNTVNNPKEHCWT